MASVVCCGWRPWFEIAGGMGNYLRSTECCFVETENYPHGPMENVSAIMHHQHWPFIHMTLSKLNWSTWRTFHRSREGVLIMMVSKDIGCMRGGTWDFPFPKLGLASLNAFSSTTSLGFSENDVTLPPKVHATYLNRRLSPSIRRDKRRKLVKNQTPHGLWVHSGQPWKST